MKKSFTSKAQGLWIVILMLPFVTSFAQQGALEGQWLARIPYSNLTYRMVLENKTSHTKLFNVTFKRYDVPMDTILFSEDRVYLRFAEFYTAFEGRYDRKTNAVVGTWITEEKRKIPVTFVQVVGDTVVGMNPRTTKSYSYKSPKEENDEWAVSSLERQSIDLSLIDSLTYSIMKEKYRDVHSLLIARNDSLVYEEYFYTFNSKLRQNIQSVTKSFVSALTGIAVGKREIKDVTDPLCQYLPSYRKFACNEQNKNISIRDLLTMSTGIEWDEATYDYGDPRNSLSGSDGDPVKYLLRRTRSSKPVFAYNSLNHTTMNAVLKGATRLDNASEIKSRLLEPLGIESYFLGKEDHGLLGDIELRPRDMMKLGQLYLNEGVWNGKQIVPSVWIKESTTKKVETPSGLGYGYFWWTRDFNWKERSVRSYFAWGYGGQYIFVVPELELVVVLTGSHWTTDPKNHVMEMLENYIIPSCE